MTSESMTEIEHARAELVATLDAIEEKLNMPRRLRRVRERTIGKLRELRGQRPLAFAVILAGATTAVGVVMFATIKLSVRGQ